MVAFTPGLLNASFPCTQFPLPSTLTPHLMGKTPPWINIITQSPMFNTGAVPGTSSTRENEMILRDGTILIHTLWPQQALQQSSPVLWCILHSTGLKAPTNQTPSRWGDAFRSYWSGNSEGTTSISHHDYKYPLDPNTSLHRPSPGPGRSPTEVLAPSVPISSMPLLQKCSLSHLSLYFTLSPCLRLLSLILSFTYWNLTSVFTKIALSLNSGDHLITNLGDYYPSLP